MTYPAKVLLYGEHTVLRNGQGLAVPYGRRSLRWTTDQPDERLLSFCRYLRAAFSGGQLIDVPGLEKFLRNGQRLTGDIPTGYGLGSSGAVCAAVWNRFATSAGKALFGEDLRQNLARMEQYFHGSSSGTDPLICYLAKPVLLGDGAPRGVDLPAGWSDRFFLVDTGPRFRPAAELIRQFTERYAAEPAFAAAVTTGWQQPADRAITALLAADYKELSTQTRTISDFQRRELADYIPETYHDRWSGNGYVLKLCGAGGGGMLLGYLIEGGSREEVEGVFGEVEWLGLSPGRGAGGEIKKAR